MDVRTFLRYGGVGGIFVWVGDVGYVSTHWEGDGKIPPQGGTQFDRMASEEECGWDIGLTPTGGGDDGGRYTGGGYLCRLPPEHSHTIYCDHAHYEPVSGGGVMPG